MRALISLSFSTLFLGLVSGLNAQTVFKFKLEPADILTVDKYQDIRIAEGTQSKSREEKNRIILKVIGQKDDGSAIQGSFFTYSRSPRLVGEYHRDKDFASRFLFVANGQQIVPDEYVMPNLRGLPTFPDKALSAGDTWNAMALETMDFDFGKIKIPVSVKYKYNGEAALPEISGIKSSAEHFAYTYSFKQDVKDPTSPFVAVTAVSADQLWFDRAQGIPVFDTNRIAYTFYMRNGKQLQMLYRIDSWWRKQKQSTEEERKDLADKIRDQVGPNANVSVQNTPDGVVLSLNAILFDTDSSNLTDDARRDLDSISEILKKYKDREIRVSGHTDSTGSHSHNMKLSDARARSVVKNLGARTGVDARRFSYKGLGSSKPVADNSTAEGRAKNRRVEILIVTE